MSLFLRSYTIDNLTSISFAIGRTIDIFCKCYFHICSLFIQEKLGNNVFSTGTHCAAMSNEEDGNDKMTER